MSKQKDWTKIDPRFSEIKNDNHAYQQRWEAECLTYENAIEWINVGWKVEDYREIILWINHGFTAIEATGWVNIGLEKYNYEIAVYARGMNYTHVQFKERINGLRMEYIEWKETPKSIYTYLEIIYPQWIRERIKNLMIDKEQKIKPASELIINGNEWKSLREIDFSPYKNNIKFKSLSLLHCEQLTNIDLSKCGIESDLLIFSQLVNLERLNIGGNNFRGDLSNLSQLINLISLDLSNNLLITGNIENLSNLVNLKSLHLENNPQFTGSLQAFQCLTKLWFLDIRNTNIKGGLEYLPESLQYFYCNIESFPELKDYDGDIFRKFQLWKQNRKKDQEQKKQIIILQEQLLSFSTNEDEVEDFRKISEILKRIEQLRDEIIAGLATFVSEEKIVQSLVHQYFNSYFQHRVSFLRKSFSRGADKDAFRKVEEELKKRTDSEFIDNLDQILHPIDQIAAEYINLEGIFDKRKSLIINQQKILESKGIDSNSEIAKYREFSRLQTDIKQTINIFGGSNQIGNQNELDNYHQSIVSEGNIGIGGSFSPSIS